MVPRPAGDPQPVADHSDPYRAECVTDAVTVDAVQMMFPDLRGAGSVELRVSPSCHVAWARFLPVAALDYLEAVVVTVIAERPGTGTALPFRVDAPHGEVWSDILLTRPEVWGQGRGHRQRPYHGNHRDPMPLGTVTARL